MANWERADMGKRSDEKQSITNPRVRDALSQLGVFERNLASNTGFANHLWKEWGYTLEDQISGVWLDLVHPDDLERVRIAYQRLLDGKTTRFDQEYRIRTRKGEWRWVRSSGRVVSTRPDGGPSDYIGADVDITELKEAEESLARAKVHAERKAQEAETLRTAGAIVASSLEIDRIMELVLQQALQVVPYDTASVQLWKDDVLEIVGGTGWGNLEEIIGTTFPIPGNNPNTEVIMEKRPVRIGNVGKIYEGFRHMPHPPTKSWMGIPLIAHADVIGLLALDSAREDFFTADHLRLATSFADHVAMALNNARLYEESRRLAMIDSLTDTSTRRAFFLQAERVFEHALRYERELSVWMMDIDHFKRVNDYYGHSRGDDVLRLLADATRATLRKTDIICRYGGEEFVVVLPETDRSRALTIAERLRTQVSGMQMPGIDQRITVSIGVSSLNHSADLRLEEVIERADKALYRAKDLGRNRTEEI